jgi:hypothetical protein
MIFAAKTFAFRLETAPSFFVEAVERLAKPKLKKSRSPSDADGRAGS